MHPSTLFRLVEEHGRPPPYTWPAALTASEEARYAPARRQQAIISTPSRPAWVLWTNNPALTTFHAGGNEHGGIHRVDP